MRRMKQHYFILTTALKEGDFVISDFSVVHHIKDVLRLEPGEKVVVSDGAGQMALAIIQQVNNKNVHLKIETITTQAQGKKVALYCAVLKREHFELVAEKAAELGVSHLVPVCSDRTIKTAVNRPRLEKIMREAAEVSERAFMPSLGTVIGFKEALMEAKKVGCTVVCDRSGFLCNDDVIEGHIKNLGRECLSLFVGPEGGWSERELREIKECQIPLLRLGDHTLRGETAALVAVFWATTCSVFYNNL